jgi:hypothetical protein
MLGSTPSAGDDRLQRAILDVATKDWCGLCEIYDHAAGLLDRAGDNGLRMELRHRLADMIAGGLVDAEIWLDEVRGGGKGADSDIHHRPLSADEIQALPIDSDLWGPPGNSVGPLRILATEAGCRLYFGQAVVVLPTMILWRRGLVGEGPEIFWQLPTGRRWVVIATSAVVGFAGLIYLLGFVWRG